MLLKDKLKWIENKLSLISNNTQDNQLSESEKKEWQDIFIEIKRLWTEIDSEIQKDIVKTRQIERKIIEMIDAFDKDDILKAKKIAWEIAHMYTITELK
ncbi:hypothetical protein KPE82_18765 [Acinetobacter baumannii]|uniref:hypothetical protein n=1 Tax=Acinetobacter baumannii TaxID=470 RepID=UPI0007D80F67|nr:hypothetical protein [Acinetobacter baumannii]MBU3097653.1 hypothetical protein [Acinetobacter baumannii]MDC4847147.1 hypothetical protein [Acinetobacter baumannii]MDV7375324.1 hypothetical protein [Acinetobacter baumannii]MDV7579540.1 hypothetical protein [Acinetobacter baumannii]MEB6637171.1 hypothetical protein [Acinetobacter baumannii]